IARGHVEQTNHGDDRRISSAEQEQKKDNADDPSENYPETWAESGGSKLLAHEPQHVLIPLLHDRLDLIVVHGPHALLQYSWQGKHGPAEQRGAENHFNRHRRDRLERFATNTRLIWSRVRIEFHHARQIRDRLDPGEGENHPDKLHPELAQTFVARLKKRS